MRLVVMAALHQDYELALQLGSHSETKQKFSEDPTNMFHLMNHLSFLSLATTN